ncbi:MAG: pilus assembly protein N-terminal domain-containing protein [Planctomycetes bacterium]|nr:pilus assembly protein N-terminal domain-containing protein [Planctomycetota bacterium]
MLMLDALKGVKPKKKTRMSSIAGGAMLLAGLAAGVPAVTTKQEAGTALVEVLTSGKRSKEIRPITESSDAYLTFAKDVETAAIGSPDIVKITTRNKREVVLNGAKVGRTSVTVWYAGGGSEQFMVAVTRDLSTLDAAIKSISPTINAEIASDRDAIVLTGTAPDEAAAKRAVEAAQSYVKASKAEGGSQGQVIDLLKLQVPVQTLELRIQGEMERMGVRGASVRRVAQGASSDDTKDVFILEGTAADMSTASNAPQLAARLLPGEGDDKSKRVINRLSVSDRPMSVEQVMQDAIRSLGCPKVVVRRVVSTEFPGDGDIVVLEGSVPTQTHLVRAVTLAGKVFQQQEITKKKREGKFETIREIDPSGQSRTTERELKLSDSSNDIKVVADESGALHRTGTRAFGGSSNAVGSVLGAAGGSSGSSNNIQRLLDNQIDSNIARAKVLEMAEGRVLSFLTVEDIPTVRVDIKLYEINRTALLTWNSQQSGGVTDFKTGSTLRDPSFVQNPVTGEFLPNPTTTPVDNPDLRNVVSFLGGGLSNRLQISGNHLQIDSLLSLLEKEGIARSLSNPQLTVLSGELAFFGVGGSVPVQNSVVTQFGSGSGGNSQAGGVAGILNQTVERDFGVRLSVRPLVEEDGMITLDVVPSVSQPDSDLTRQIRESTGQSLATTAFQERSLRTSARMRDGGTLLIGGLTSHSRTDNTNQTPFLHKLPIIGNLFKGYSYGDDDRELVIVVNPVIVREAPKEAPMWAFPDTRELMSVQPGRKAAKPAGEKQ